jgi:hypothetical protein
MDKVLQRPGVMQKFSATLKEQRDAKLRAKRGVYEVFEVNTTNEIDWDELRRVGAEFEHENIVMLGSKVDTTLI